MTDEELAELDEGPFPEPSSMDHLGLGSGEGAAGVRRHERGREIAIIARSGRRAA